MRVWHILERYPPEYGGGAAITTQDVCRALAARGNEVRVLCADNTSNHTFSIRTEFDGAIRVDRVNLPYFLTEDPDGWRLGADQWAEHETRIARVIDEIVGTWRPDIVDYHTARPFGEECLTSVVRHGLPLVATLHDAWLICGRVMLLRSPTSEACDGPSRVKCIECIYSNYDGSRWKAALKLPLRAARNGTYFGRRLQRRAEVRTLVTAGIARSEFMADVHRPYLRRVKHIPFGLDLTDLPRRKSIPKGSSLRFGFVAGFQKTKGIDQVLNAMESIKRDGIDCTLDIWGPGNESSDSEIEARQLCDRVRYHGMFSPSERWTIYEQMDIALMATNVSEPFGRVPLEAAAMGVPTIAPAIGGIRETIRDGVDGLHYRFRDGKDLEHQMRRVIADRDLFVRLQNNLRVVPDTREQVHELENLYREVLREQ